MEHPHVLSRVVASSDANAEHRPSLPGPDDAPDRLEEPRAVAALALGLAYSPLDEQTALTELTINADRLLLVRARGHLSSLATHDVTAGVRAQRLLERALDDAEG